MPIRWNKLLIVLFFLIVNISFSQEKNPTVYPYGGVPDSSRFEPWMQRVPLNFKTANFDSVQFDNPAEFSRARFDRIATFGQTIIKEDRIGVGAFVHFYNWADFTGAEFDSVADFGGTNFHGRANFVWAHFHGRTYFVWTRFHDKVHFGATQFDSIANFRRAEFDDKTDFRLAKFDSINFDDSVIRNEIAFGSNENRLIDFTKTNFIAKAKIVLYKPVKLIIQPEKFKYILLGPRLDYFSKKKIIEELKNNKTFKEDNKAQFELNYIFDKSTMYQEQSNKYEEKWYHIWKYPKWFSNTLYYLTMGLGYRPFRLVWWVLGSIIGFGIFYFFKMRDSINGYILKKFEMKEASGTKRKKDAGEVSTISHTESLMNCIYFSSMLLFSFRLKGEILTFFKLKEKRYIVGEYLLGLLIYIAFLTLAKSGSILHNLRSLFVG